MRRGLAVWSVVLVLVVSGCGAQQPVASGKDLHRSSGDSRVFAQYRNTQDTLRHKIRLAAKTQHVKVRMDCIGKGEIQVDVFGGTTGVPCSDHSQSSGFIGLTEQKALRRATTSEVVVRAPKDSTWSVVVDAGPGKIKPEDE